jgi:hypothetical protein
MMNDGFVRVHVKIADAGHDEASSSILLKDDATSSISLLLVAFFFLGPGAM